MNATPTVYLVDDDEEFRHSLGMLLRSMAMEVRSYPSADAFLADPKDLDDPETVLLLDVRMPGMSGMALLERLRALHPSLPIILITGHGDIDMAVRAMKLGAMDFITKPFSSQSLLDRIYEVLRQSGDPAAGTVSAEEAAARLDALTPREREVFDRIVSGESNKVVASELGISVRTVESHRASIMEKLDASTLVDLVLLSVSLGARDHPR
jgi:FixJ family two-component response regulator